jgi:hypothetical protein
MSNLQADLYAIFRENEYFDLINSFKISESYSSTIHWKQLKQSKLPTLPFFVFKVYYSL